MYSTCLFCHAALGRNETLEVFPVGRRLAYDESKGRLWVLCTRCDRWNLSPLETRWEAIEMAERAFRSTRLRVATDNIALAQMRDGLQLVRIGAPPPLEMAAWRYGDKFGRRRRKHLMVTGAIGGAGSVYVASSLATIGVLNLPLMAASASVIGVLWQAGLIVYLRRDSRKVRSVVHDDAGNALAITAANLRGAAIVPDARTGEWKLRLPYRTVAGAKDMDFPGEPQVMLEPEPAKRALSQLLPLLNRSGGSERHVREAVAVIDHASSIDDLLRKTALDCERQKKDWGTRFGESNITKLPSPLRLAMEMSLHDSEEQRALQGELAQLHDRWKEAEEIAKIADSLLLPPDSQV